MFSPRPAVLAALVLSSSVLAGPAVARASAAVPQIGDAVAVAAPRGGHGGVMTPFVSCSNDSVNPHVESTITNTANGNSHPYSWTGAYPGWGFPRVAVGSYQVHTEAVCNGTSRVRDEIVKVTEKTAKRTVSRSEWNRIKPGMTVKRVAAIVGYNGIAAGRYQGRAMRQYDMMPFWQWAIIEYRHGKVAGKQWNVGHD